MPAIWNINSAYNINNKKVSSKLTFEVGEKFSGRIISKGEGNEAVIKLLDGWQFEAEIQGDINLDNLGLIKFEVEGFEDGKLKLKVLSRESGAQSFTSDGLNEIIQKEGLAKEDILILKEMIKHNMPLTKDNINFIKGLLQFKDKINSNPSEVNNFIEKFLSVKGVSKSTEEGQVFSKVLNDFMKAFKGMKSEELFLFLENDIELNKENIDSFNKLFKSEKTLHEYFRVINDDLSKLDLSIEKSVNSNSIETLNEEVELKLQNKHVDTLSKENVNQTNGGLASKVYDSNDVSKGKVNMLSLLKSLVGNEDDVLKDSLKNIIMDRVSTFTKSEFNTLNTTINNLSEERLFSIFNDFIKEDGSEPTKENIERALKTLFGKDIKLSEGEFQRVVDSLKLNEKFQEFNTDNLHQREAIKELKDSLIEEKDLNLSPKDIIKDDIKSKVDSIKDVVKELLQHAQSSGKSSEKIMEFLKGSINDFKLLNAINNEYYYLDIPIRREERDYPCKLIIKDNRKDGKIIDKTNVKLVVSVRTVNIGTIDGYLKVQDKNLEVDLKCEEKFVKAINISKNKLMEGLNSLGFNSNIIVSKRIEEVGLASCREFFNSNNNTLIDTKV